MSVVTMLRSEIFRLMLAGFLVGSAGIGAVSAAQASSSPVQLESVR